jgi:2-methylcitrate dehydratase PrpD
VAAALLLGLDGEGVATAVEIAANLAPAGTFEACLDGSTVRNTYAGAGAQIGVRSAQLAAAGFTAPPGSCEVAYGSVRGTGLRTWPRPVDGWAIGSGYLKRWSSCAFTHSVLDAVLELRTRRELDPASIENVVVRVPAVAAQLGGVHTSPPLAARFSIPVLVALLLEGADLQDPATCETVPAATEALAGRVEVIEDAASTAQWPGHSAAEVRVVLADGTRLVGSVPDPVTPQTDDAYVDAVVAKLERLSLMSPAHAVDLMEALQAAHSVPSIFGPDDVSEPHPGVTSHAAHTTGVL